MSPVWSPPEAPLTAAVRLQARLRRSIPLMRHAPRTTSQCDRVGATVSPATVAVTRTAGAIS